MTPFRAWAVVFDSGRYPLCGWGPSGQYPIFNGRSEAVRWKKEMQAKYPSSVPANLKVVPVRITGERKEGRKDA